MTTARFFGFTVAGLPLRSSTMCPARTPFSLRRSQSQRPVSMRSEPTRIFSPAWTCWRISSSVFMFFGVQLECVSPARPGQSRSVAACGAVVAYSSLVSWPQAAANRSIWPLATSAWSGYFQVKNDANVDLLSHFS
jgi:hypothetical protein